MREFNRRVNTSYNPDYKYVLWSEYRKQNNKLIDDIIALNGQESNEIIVLGAGECNDLDLEYICSNFHRVVLTDVDSRSLKEGINRQSLTEDALAKIHIKEVEYTGLEEIKFFERVLQMVEQKVTKDKILFYIEETRNRLKEIRVLEEYRNRFAVVLTTSVYTQLVYTQSQMMLDVIKHLRAFDQTTINEIEMKILDVIPDIIEGYNALLISLASKKSVIGMWTDILQFETRGKMKEDIRVALELKELQSEVLEKYIVDMAGKGLAYYGREDLLNRIDAVKSYWWIWPFDEAKSYLVYGCIGIPREV